jgi:head-tail adaptor
MNPLLAAGRLNRRVTIVRPTFTTNSINEQVEGEPSRTTVSASMAPDLGGERFQNGELGPKLVMKFVFRWHADLVRLTDRIEADDGLTYEIIDRNEIGLREGIAVRGVALSETA